MRWKLIMITSFLGAFVAGGAWCLLTISVFRQFSLFVNYSWLTSLSLIIPIAVSAFAAIFVYRHTAQRRKTQALLTIILTLLLTLSVYVAVMRYQGFSIVARPIESTSC
jgi:hypothetical protein